jgi:hypothetical protein
MRPTILGRATWLVAALGLGCASPVQHTSILDERQQLELQRPEPTVRTSEGEGPRTRTVPREVPAALTAEVAVSDALDGTPLGSETFRLSPDRVSVTAAGGVEWWLERNVRHRDELRGALVEPDERLVLLHTPGELRARGNDGLWDQILALGGPPAPSEPLRPAGRAEEAFGLRFEEWTSPDESSVLQQVWWNADAELALRVVLRRGERLVRRELVALEWGADEAGLRDPAERHPQWRHCELSDEEGLGDHAHDHGGGGA